jgi:hypothetical protein
MKYGLAAFAVLPWLVAGLQKPNQEVVILIAGDINGYLSPCGCTKPMQGGIRRLASAVKANTVAGQTIFLFNGGFVAGNSRQDQLKAEAIGEALGRLKVTAVNLNERDTSLGVPLVESITRLSSKKVVASDLEAPGFLPDVRSLGFRIQAVGSKDRLAGFNADSRSLFAGTLPRIVMVQGDPNTSATWTKGAKLVITSKATQAMNAPEKKNGSWWVFPGEKGKQILRLTWNGKQFTSYRVINLGPEWDDNKDVSLIYSRYLKRVTSEKLLEQMPRSEGEKFAGSKTCGSCHADAYKIWANSLHSSALKTLENDGHDRDPDCVSCHVVGLDKNTGFMDRSSTPELADVGCESCHGAGSAHSMKPESVDMIKIGANSCMSCHVKNHSPKFDYEKYWQKIKH